VFGNKNYTLQEFLRKLRCIAPLHVGLRFTNPAYN
jgi:hypothetical protein